MNNIEMTSKHLIKNGVTDYEVINHDAVKTMQDVFQIIQAPPSQMIKAVLLKIKKDPIQYLLLGIPADRLANLNHIAKMINLSKNRISLASADDVRQVMNCEPGALPPFSMDHVLVPFIIDSSFSKYEYIFCGMGTHFHTLRIRVDELRKLPGFDERELMGI